jgi:hypothetical protein
MKRPTKIVVGVLAVIGAAYVVGVHIEPVDERENKSDVFEPAGGPQAFVKYLSPNSGWRPCGCSWS